MQAERLRGGMAGEESQRAVLTALAANSIIAVGKLAAGAVTGSGALFAEGGHSIADTVNQVFLLVGLKRAETRPDEEHPHGYGKEAFFLELPSTFWELRRHPLDTSVGPRIFE